MNLTPFYTRMAVRPFPHTRIMDQIIEIARSKLREIIRGKIDRTLDGRRDFLIWDQDVSGPSGEFSLKIYLKVGPFVLERHGQAVIDVEKREALIDIELLLSPFFGGYKKYLENKSFETVFVQMLHHELIHVFDPKSWSREIQEKFPAYIDPGATGKYEEYSKHPFETTAYGGETYYYFKDKADSGVPFREAVHSFLTGNHGSRTYRETVKRSGPKNWQDYLTRIYKSAQQAYQDLGKLNL